MLLFHMRTVLCAMNIECKCVNAECLWVLMSDGPALLPLPKIPKAPFQAAVCDGSLWNRFLSHTCVISFEECNQHCVQRANREEEGGVTWEAFLLECGRTARDKKQNKTVNFRSGWYFKLKAASVLTNGLLLQKRAATAALRGFVILGSLFQWWPYRLFLYPSSCVALLHSMLHRTPEDLLWRLALRNAVEFVLGEKNEL